MGRAQPKFSLLVRLRHTQQQQQQTIGFRLQVRLAKGRRNFKTAVLGERRYFGEMFMLLPEHVPFRGLAQVCAPRDRR